MSERLTVAMTGASGSIYTKEILKQCRELQIETHLVISKAALVTSAYELEGSIDEVKSLADHVYNNQDIAAPISSGSFIHKGMIIAPCSMNTLAEIANGLSGNLISRAADVTLKERRPLVLMVRETPLTNVHLKNMLTVSQAGGIVFPPVPAFYNRPENLSDVVHHSVGRALDLFGLRTDGVKRWKDA